MQRTTHPTAAIASRLAASIVIVTAATLLAASDTKRELPAGFTYLPEFAEANVFERWSEGARRGVHSITSGDVGIIRKPIDLPLTATTELEFDWKFVALPALGPETDAATHDYHSVAVEFDNGQDLTWFWSRELEPGTRFRCPLPNWDQRETHIVLQSGNPGLGEWKSHRRPILADYTEAVGGEKPARIVAVWFIANSYFGKKPGEAYFANVRLRDGERTVEVFEK
jgi:hypothetical protein